MKPTILLTICLAMLSCSYTMSQDQIKISINKNDKGEMVFNVSGHTAPVVLEVNGKSATVQVGQSEVNMEQAFGFSAYSSKNSDSELDVNTAAGAAEAVSSGTGAISGPQQFNPLLNPNLIPPVSTNINPNPPLATPY